VTESYRPGVTLFAEIRTGVGLALALPGFLRRPFSIAEAHAMVNHRLRNRAENFLELMRRAVFAGGPSPYRPLLAAAGCELGDLEAGVRSRGLEATLADLATSGVCLSLEEFKGRRAVRRGSVNCELEFDVLRNPLVQSHLAVQSSQSRGASAPVPVDLAFVRDHAVDTHLTLDVLGGRDWDHAHYGVPGGGAMTNLLDFAVGGRPAKRFFSPVEAGSRGLHPRYRWSGRLLRSAGAVAGVRIPALEYAPFDDPFPIVRWMSETLARGRTPHLWTYSSSAVRVCQRALDAEVSLAGAHFTMGGEPSTAARIAVVRSAGARPWPRYGSTETDIIAFSCLHPGGPDDMHLLQDRRAVIRAGSGAPAELPEDALLFTSLLPSDPIVLLNVSLGDRADIQDRPCGCPLERLGFPTHLSGVRSFEKLTAAGMNFLDADLTRVLDEVLPARFGGGPLHYQLVEEEDLAGVPRLRLLVDPEVGPLDVEQVRETLLSEIGSGSGVERLTSLAWKEARLLRVDRAAPIAGRSGKILHLHRSAGLIPV
jgi:hypothetical protein